MKSTPVKTNPEVAKVFNSYPENVKDKIAYLRELIIQAADEIEEITEIEETLKWGEPSYLVKKGSTIRIDWKKKKPDQYAMYFKCTSKLVPAFKTLYKDLFQFEGNRAIVFKLDDRVPEEELKQCIKTGLTYHRVKDLPLLGM
jgi:hypothetical protein